jgi:thiamine phosphate synthase YjbQ (UPF0047 family)
MTSIPAEIHLSIRPKARTDLIDVTRLVRDEFGDFLSAYRRAIYCSYHTTAGYLEQSLCSRLHHSRDQINTFIRVFQGIFPPEANYEHDKLHLRDELSAEERNIEPRNADSHLTFISSGLKNCATYIHRRQEPVYFIDLDGVHEHGVRNRRTTVLGYNKEVVVGKHQLPISVSAHPVDSINLRHPECAFFEQLQDLVTRHGISRGRVDLSLEPDEQGAGLTVNEYETLLMRHDLREILHNPVRFMAQKGRNILRNPLAVPSKTINYAQYDLVHALNQLMDTFKVSESFVESLVAKVMAVPASRFLRLKRSVSLLVTNQRGSDSGQIVQGKYQSPILVQWNRAAGQTRNIDITLTEFK